MMGSNQSVVSIRVPSASVTERLESRTLLNGVLPTGTTAVATGDFNADGNEDTVVFARARHARRIAAEAGIAGPRRSSLFFVDGMNGTVFGGTGVNVPSRGATPIVLTGDFNRDGRTDLLLANRGPSGGGNGVEVLLSNARGNLTRRRTPAPANISAVSVSDVNGDGDLDLIVTADSNRGGPRIRTLVPDTRAQFVDSGRLLAPPALSGGATFEAGGAGGAIRTTNPAFDNLDTTGLIGLGTDAVLTSEQSTGGSAAGTNAGTFSADPGVSGETGGSISGGFGNQRIGIDDGSAGAGSDVFVLIGNGNGTFSRSTRRGS